jgi:hypothetical protein
MTARILIVAVFATLAVGGPAAAAEAPNRHEYVAQLERICRPDSAATQRAVRGTRADVRAERFRRAAAKVARARRIFTGTVRAIARVPRPRADGATLGRWFAALKREARALGKTAASLRT